MSTLNPTRVINIAAESVIAFARHDTEALDRILQPIYNGDAADGLAWMACIIQYTTHGIPRREDLPEDVRERAILQPLVAAIDENTGRRVELDMDTVPLGIATYARLVVAYIDDQPDLATALWSAMLTAPPDDDEDEGGHLATCMFYGLSNAAAKYRHEQIRAASQ
jgi:hypothetical protein